MKNLITMLLGMLCLFSCTKVVYTQQKVMQRYITQQAVIKRFGYPDEKKESNGITEWLYNYDGPTILINSKTSMRINTTRDLVPDTSKGHTVTVAQFTPRQKYIKFTFDQDGKVLTYDAHGVNLAEKKPAKFRTILLVTGLALAILTVVAEAANPIGDFHFAK